MLYENDSQIAPTTAKIDFTPKSATKLVIKNVVPKRDPEICYTKRYHKIVIKNSSHRCQRII
jgi:hypothetical protein